MPKSKDNQFKNHSSCIQIISNNVTSEQLEDLSRDILKDVYRSNITKLSSTESKDIGIISRPQIHEDGHIKNKKFIKWTKCELLIACKSMMLYIKEKEKVERSCPICNECTDGRNCVTPECGHTICTECAIKLRHANRYRTTPCCLCRQPIMFM